MTHFFKRTIIRTTLFGYFLFHLGMLHAQTYYVSPSGNAANNGTSPSTAWATIERVNQVIPSLKPGNSVLFECGGTYYGSMFANDHTPNNDCEIIGNKIDHVGYNAIFVYFSQNLLIKNNVIDYSMLCLSDGGGIYIGNDPSTPRNLRGIQIIDNIVMNTIGNIDGIPLPIMPDIMYCD